MPDAPPPPTNRPPLRRSTRLLIWLLPLPLAAAPMVAVLLHGRGFLRGSMLHDIVLMPLVLGMLPGMMFRSSTVMLLTAGLYWYLLGFSILSSLYGRPGAVSRLALLGLIVSTIYIVTCGMNWNPD